MTDRAHDAPGIAGLDARLLEQLVTRTMPFGKHQGTLLADLPGHYLNWFARTGFPPGEIGRLLALMQTIDHNGLRPLLDPLRHKPRERARLRPPAPRA
ncbi:cytoplasmic protein [Comamonas serinivorans]|uniref:Cytoplasmic protein n=2 Tax=Comamonas serinivorans TaxID=1082851 RepID=A0A1Y0EKV3_9BURK|nr:cytoplasmic protein [Comamonas serinivorans]